jgi:carboxymethylenebutenolidase
MFTFKYRIYSGSSGVGVILIHEIFGLTSYEVGVATSLAGEGYWTILPDLYGGRTASSLEEGFRLRAMLNTSDVVETLRTAYRILRLEMGDDARIGFMGFCMGGGFALLGGCSMESGYVIDYYGMMEDVEKVRDLHGPLQLILASEDQRVTTWAYQSLIPALVRYRKRADIHLYPDTQHAFHRPNWPGHNPEAAREAWSKTQAFLSQFR